MTIAGKVWGVTSPIIQRALVELHHVTAKPGHHCSWHKHSRKWNAFYCLEGVLIIEVQKSYELTDRTILKKGQSTEVPPGEKHRFMTEESPAEFLELYYLEPLGDDIVRDDQGGANGAPKGEART